MQWSKSFDYIFKKKGLPSARWFSSVTDLLTVCTIYQASAQVTCDDFFTCPGCTGYGYTSPFQNSNINWTESTLNTSSTQQLKLTRNDCVSRCLQILLRTSKKKEEKKKETSRSQSVDFDHFIFAFHFLTVVEWVLNSRIKMNSVIFTKSSLGKIAAIQWEKDHVCVKVAFC